MNSSGTIVPVLIVAAAFFFSGCTSDSPSQQTGIPTADAVRRGRRAFEGAPPVVPHKPQRADCTACHTTTGALIPNMGFASANPHAGGAGYGSTQNCRQCHLFRTADAVLVASSFESHPGRLRKGERAFPGAPPMIPHVEFMRENCVACHSGPAARIEIRCTHTDRTNCQQCHLAQNSAAEFVSAAAGAL